MPNQDLSAPVAIATGRWATRQAVKRLTRALEHTQKQLAAAHTLIGLYQRSMNLPSVPPAFARALRDGAWVTRVTIGRDSVAIGLPGQPCMADPVGEGRAWQRHVQVHEAVAQEPAVPHAVGLRVAELPEGHRWQAWRTAGIGRPITVVVNSLLSAKAARLAVREALRIVRL